MDDVFSANTGHLRWSANIPRTRNSLSRFKKNMAFPRCRFSFDASAPAVRVKAHTVTLPSIFYFLKKREVSPYWYLSNSLQCIQNVCSGEHGRFDTRNANTEFFLKLCGRDLVSGTRPPWKTCLRNCDISFISAPGRNDMKLLCLFICMEKP